MTNKAHQSEQEERIGKIKSLRDSGVDPFPSWNKERRAIADFLDNFEMIGDSPVTVAGRIMSIRRQGGTTFAHVQDESGIVQFFIKKNEVGEEQYGLLKQSIDRGDIIAGHGTPMTTKKGEKSLMVQSFELLTKTVMPLAEKRAGLKDRQTQLRKRYLDMLSNPEVLERFKMKSKLINTIREFLDNQGYIEVETPVLQPLYGGGFARPFNTKHNALGIDMYLRISTELYLKRFVVGGLEKVYEIAKMFRNEGVDKSHNPEFTMLETMAAYHDYTYNMDLIEQCYEFCAQKLLGSTDIIWDDQTISVARPWKRITMVDAISEHTGVDVSSWKSIKEAHAALKKAKISSDKIKTAHNVGLSIALLFEERVEEKLIQPTIVYEYPVETSPLAKRVPGKPEFVERFEHFILGSEHGNNYSELNDPLELEERFIEESKKAKAGSTVEDVHEPDHDFVEAMKHGMPPTTGAAIGIDRMAMLFTNAQTIRDVIPFPVLKPKK